MSADNDDSVPRLGEILVKSNSLRKEQVGMLLDEQRDIGAVGVHSRIGEIAVRKGWVEADQVTTALRSQAQAVIDRTDAGRILQTLGWISPAQLVEVRHRCARSAETVEEAAAALGICPPEKLRLASVLATILSANAVRKVSGSSFSPYNIMELIVGEETSTAIRADGLCCCSQCWSNVFALALNAMPARYVSDHGRILDFYRRFREEYGVLAAEQVQASLLQVRNNPKASCWSRFSDKILSGQEQQDRIEEISVRVSSRHVHLTAAAMEKLFGRGAILTPLEELSQPGQFAATETVDLVGPRGRIEKVRIHGPLRNAAQVEISGTDQFTLGIQAPVRESGRLEGSPGIVLAGPAGEVSFEHGVIRSLRHIHMLAQDADRIGVKNGAHVSVRLVGDRTTIAEGVLVRVGQASSLEMHIDTDEANAAGIPAVSTGQILIPMMAV
jgi:putative phosphotransacetylase